MKQNPKKGKQNQKNPPPSVIRPKLNKTPQQVVSLNFCPFFTIINANPNNYD